MTGEFTLCHFCNGPCFIETETSPLHYEGKIHFVECLNCACRGPWAVNINDAMNFWNRAKEKK